MKGLLATVLLLILTSGYSSGHDHGVVGNGSGVKQLTDNNAMDFQPALLEDHTGRLWVVWTSYRDGNTDIYYRVYDKTWGEEQQLTVDLHSDFEPCILEDKNGTIWIFWSSSRSGTSHIYCRRFDGQKWSEEERVTDTLWNQDPSAVTDREGRIMLVWLKNYSIWYTIYDGRWGEERKITYQEADDEDPEVCMDSSGTIWLVWFAYSAIPCDVYTGTWSEPIVLSKRGVVSREPAIASWGREISLFYLTDQGIVYRVYRDGKWGKIRDFVTTQRHVEGPAVGYSKDGTLLVAWCGGSSSHSNTFEIYLSVYREDPSKFPPLLV